MNRRSFLVTAIAAATVAALSHQSGHATTISLYVDSAPNVYGSPDWAPWWTQTKADVVAGTFQNLRTGTYPGTLDIDPYDEIVYSTLDLGKRLHWIYWMPGETVANLNNRFEVKWVIDWGGENWTLDENGHWALDSSDVGWSQPTRWEDYNGGVIGSLGFAWWSTDNDAPPFDTDHNPYNETDQDDIDALRLDVFKYQTFAEGFVRIRDDVNSEWEVSSLRVDVVPDGSSTLLLAGLAVAGLAGFHRRLKS
jgi:hypothetical protein